jgi:hypothetical protein
MFAPFWYHTVNRQPLHRLTADNKSICLEILNDQHKMRKGHPSLAQLMQSRVLPRPKPSGAKLPHRKLAGTQSEQGYKNKAMNGSVRLS